LSSYSFANANVLLVLGELMGSSDTEDGSPNRSAIPLTAGAIITAQVTMAVATWIGDHLTEVGIGRKPLFMGGLISLPIRCALIILLKDAGQTYLLSTQILDGIGGGLMGLIHPYLVADLTFGTGRFNVVSKFSHVCGAYREQLECQESHLYCNHNTSLSLLQWASLPLVLVLEPQCQTFLDKWLLKSLGM
jgi:MFS family permease